MIRKLLLVAAVFLFFLFLHVKVSQMTIKTYQSNLNDINKLVTESIEIAKVSKEASSRLIDKIDYLDSELKDLEDKHNKLKEELGKGDVTPEVLFPVKERIKKIASMIDSMDLSPRRKARLDSRLASIYRELDAIDDNLVKVVKKEPLYQDKYEEVKEQLQDKSRQIDDLTDELKNLESQLKGQQKQLQDLQTKNERYVSEIEDSKSLINSQKQELNSLKKARSKFGDEASEYKKAVDALEREKVRYASVVQEKEEKIESYENEIGKLKRANDVLIDQLQLSSVDIEELSGRINTLLQEKEALVTEKNRLNEKIVGYAESIDSLNKEVQNLLERISQVKKEKEDLIISSEQKDKALSSISEEKMRLQALMEKLQGDLGDKQAKMDGLKNELAALITDYDNISAQYHLAVEKIKDHELELGKRADRILTLQDDMEENDAALSKITADMEQQLKELADVRGQIVAVKMENNRLRRMLNEKSSSLDTLEKEIRKIRDVNLKFKEYIEKASDIFEMGPEEKLGPPEELVVDELEPVPEDFGSKAVDVEIESVETEGMGELPDLSEPAEELSGTEESPIKLQDLNE